jgi:type I restriction enzyme S subunit
MFLPQENWIALDFHKSYSIISTVKIKIKQRDYLIHGAYPVVDQGSELVGGYYNDNEFVIQAEPPFIVFGDHTKVVKYIDFKFIPGADGVKVLKPLNMFEPKLFYYFIKQLPLPDKGYARHFQHLSKCKIPLPPLPEQRAIVSKLETLLSELDNAVASLKQAKEQIKTYRQSVLKAAFSGNLTKSEGESWTKQVLSEVVQLSQGIQVPKEDQMSAKQKGYIRFLRIIDFTQGSDSPRYVANPGIKYYLNKDEIAMVRYGTVGFVCRGMEGAIANNLFKLTPQDNVDTSFLYYFLQSPYFQSIVAFKNKGATMPAISFAMFKEVEFSYPNIHKQSMIVQEIESRFSIADQLELTIDDTLSKTAALKQSLLKQAFEGKLLTELELEQTRQAPDWEPAEKLLKRIKSPKSEGITL